MCVCIHIYMDICLWVFVCVCRWVAFLTSARVSRGTHLSILAQRSKPWKPARPEEKDEGSWSVRSETLKQWVRHSKLRMWGWAVKPRTLSRESTLRCGSRVVREWYGVKNEDTEQWRWWPDESAFLVDV